MQKNPLVRTVVDSEHVKGSERLLKSARQYFSHIFWSLWKKISSINSFLVVCEIILTPDDKYSLAVKASVWPNQFKWYYLKIKNHLLIFFGVSRIYIKLEYFEKKMSLGGYLFLKV